MKKSHQQNGMTAGFLGMRDSVEQALGQGFSILLEVGRPNQPRQTP